MIAAIRRLSLSQWILISMALGIFCGWRFPEIALHGGVLSNLFIRLVKCIVVPLIFSTLVVG
ncbi:MAG: cation:dicarboxylase symporter family transporter, partial [Verrucomicrobia bacterium]|nr:cation:dicarboxylase symporter family transporter [Verrucomicrobiota bacterium]